MTWEWRNDAATRRFSRDHAPISWTDHAAWFATMLNDADRVMFIGAAGTEAIGALRFDCRGHAGAWRVSIVIAPRGRGQGLGARLLDAGCGAMLLDYDRPRFIAEIMLENIASRAMFARRGFRDAGPAPDARFSIFTLP